MAPKDYLGIIDNGLKHLFDRKATDPAKTRRPLIRGIDRTPGMSIYLRSRVQDFSRI